MEFHEIRYFLALSQTLNFTKAAEACHVSQPALTRAIRKMEGELGGLLFSRDHSNVRLTDLGQLIEPGLSEALQRTGDAKKAASRFLRLEQADMVLGVMCTIAPVRFVGFLGKFRADHPGVALTLKESVPERLCELLLEGELDVALMARPTGFDAPLQATELYTEPFVIACSAGHALAAKREVAIADLDGENYLSRISCEFIDVLGELCRSRGVNLVRSYRSEREDWILNMVAAGLGVCFLPAHAASFPGVVARPVVEPAVARSVCLVTVRGRRSSPAIDAFVNAVKRHGWSLFAPTAK